MISNELIFGMYTVCIAGVAIGAALVSVSALTALICLQAVLMNLFVTKSIILCGWTATASDALGVGAVLCLNLLQEFYGRSAAKQAIWLSFGSVLLFTVLSWLHCAYIPSCVDTMHNHFEALLCPMPRLVIASLISYLLTQLFDRWLYEKAALFTAGRYFVARNIFTIGITQLLDTVLFGILGLYGLMAHLTDIIVVSYGVKLAALAIAVPCIALAHYLHRAHV